MDERQKAYNERDIIRTLTLDEARQLGGMLGKVCEAKLKKHGWYSYTANCRTRRRGDKVFVTLKAKEKGNEQATAGRSNSTTRPGKAA